MCKIHLALVDDFSFPVCGVMWNSYL